MSLKLTLLVIVIFVAITDINARVRKLRDRVAAKINIGKKLSGRNHLAGIAGIINRNRGHHQIHQRNKGNRFVGSIVNSISNILGLVINILVHILGAVGRNVSLLISQFADLNELNVNQIEITIKSLVTMIAQALTSAATSIADVELKLKNCHQLSLLEKKKLLIDIGSVLSNLNMFKIKIQTGLTAANSAYIRSSGTVKIKVKDAINILTSQLAQVDIQISSAMVVRNILNGNLIGIRTGSIGTVGTGLSQSDSIDNIPNEANVVVNILIKLLDGIKERVDVVISLYAIPSERTAQQIETIVTDIAGFVPKALIPTMKHLANIKLKLDNSVQLSMVIKQKLSVEMSSVLNNLSALRSRFQLGVDASNNVINSLNAPTIMKMKANYASATFTAQIAQIDILIGSATYLSNAVNGGQSVEKEGPKTPVARDASDIRVQNSSKTLTESLAALRGMLDHLLTYLDNDDYSNTIAIVSQLSGTASNTWILIRITVRDIEGKLFSGSELGDNDKNKYLGAIDALIKILLTVKVRFDQAIKATIYADDRANKQNKATVNSAASELKDGLAQLELIISEVKNISTIVNSDSFGSDRTGDGSDGSAITGTNDDTVDGSSVESVSIGSETATDVTDEVINETVSENKVPEDESKPEDSKTGLIGDLNVIRAKIDNLSDSIKQYEYEKVSKMITRLVSNAGNTWTLVSKFSSDIEVTLSSGTDLKDIDHKKYFDEITVLLKKLLSLKLKFEQLLKSGNEAADRAPKTVRFAYKTILNALRYAIAQIDIRITEVTHIETKLKTSSKGSVTVDNESTDMTSSSSDAAYKIGRLVDLFSSELTTTSVAQIEGIIVDLKRIITFSLKSVNTTVVDIKAKLIAGKQFKDSEKMQLSSNITSELSILINLKPKIQLALNAAIKSSTKLTGSFKTKADSFLLTLRALIIFIDIQIAQAIQIQISLNVNTSKGTVTGGMVETNSTTGKTGARARNMPGNIIGTVSKEEKSSYETQNTQTTHTAEIEALGSKVNYLIKGLYNEDFDKIGDIVRQLKEPLIKACDSVSNFIAKMKNRISVTKFILLDKTKCLADITAFLKSLLSIKIKCVLVLKATNEAALKATGTVKTNMDNLISTFSTQMAMIDNKITDLLKTQFKLNGGKAINLEFETENKQKFNIKSTYNSVIPGTDIVHVEQTFIE